MKKGTDTASCDIPSVREAELATSFAQRHAGDRSIRAPLVPHPRFRRQTAVTLCGEAGRKLDIRVGSAEWSVSESVRPSGPFTTLGSYRHPNVAALWHRTCFHLPYIGSVLSYRAIA